MIAYPDTSFLCALYRSQHNTRVAVFHRASMKESLALTSLLIFEFRQSVRWQNALFAQDRTKGFSKQEGMKMLADVQSDLDSRLLELVPAEWPDVLGIAERLSAHHTVTKGCRGFDILHVATALHLEAREFLTFDVNQRKLAEAEGLTVPL